MALLTVVVGIGWKGQLRERILFPGLLSVFGLGYQKPGFVCFVLSA